MTQAPEDKKPKKKFRLAIFALLALSVVGGAGGFLFPILKANASAPAEEAVPVMSSMDIGKIVVNLDPKGSSANHLVLETVLQYDAAGLGESPDLETYRLQVRDAFIGYLANISESEVRGSSGMSNLREELLRRARVAFDEGEPHALLIQNYVLQ